jgi:Acyl-CoA dehydrogenase, N-terminal domain
MSVKFPVDRAEKRRVLLQAVTNVRDILAADAEESEVLRTLPPASVTALTDSGLFAMKCPADLGGAEADPVTQIEVIEATNYIDPAAGWCLMICNGGIAMAGVEVVCLMSVRGILMAPLPGAVIASVILACALYLIALDFLKVPILSRLMYTS